jgi:hypothetical protein
MAHLHPTEAAPEEPAYFALLPTTSRSLRLALVSVLTTLALACQDSTAPDPQLPSAEAGSEPQEPASLVDQARWADGYVFASNPTAAAYTPDPFYSFNRTGGAIRITKPAGTTGRYLVKFTGLSAFLGSKSTVQVTGFSSNAYCKPSRAYLVNDLVEVHCFQPSSGAIVNARFTLLVLSKRINLAFAHAHLPSGTNYTPKARGSWNPGGPIKVIRNGVGAYTVVFTGLGTLPLDGNKGHVQVSAVGSGSEHCGVESWALGGSVEAVFVRCHTRAGARADAKFNVLFLAPSDRLAYAWASHPSDSSYTAPVEFSMFGPTSIRRIGTGKYIVTWEQSASQLLQGGNVQVTTYHAEGEHCNVTEWGNTHAVVACFAPNGVPVDASYTVLLGS